MSSVKETMTASSFLRIQDRATELEAVERELQSLVNAQPTQIHPDDRVLLIDAILSDLAPISAAPWTSWSLDPIKTLGRNPIGSEGLYSSANYPILCFHSGLPFPPSSEMTTPSSTSNTAKEAMKVLANLGVQHQNGRDCLAQAGGARAIAKALADQEPTSQDVDEGKAEEDVERLFLLARLGFLVTLDREDAVKVMVDEEDIIDTLVHYLTTIEPIPANFNALNDMLKFANNIIRFYPFVTRSSSSHTTATPDWDDRFDDLFWAVLCLFHSIPFTELAPPLSHCLHVLLCIPWTERLLSTWHAVPARSADSAVYSVLERLAIWSTNTTSPPESRRPSAEDAAKIAEGDQSDKGRAPALSNSVLSKKRYNLPARKEEPTAFVERVIQILVKVLDRWLPFPSEPDDVGSDILTMDEHLPQILLLLARGADGSIPTRHYLKNLLLPADLDRSPAAGPLEKRPGLLGTLLRFMACTNHPQSKLSAGELLWSVCGSDPSTLNAEIGYGNAAGFLVFKGIFGVPQGRVEEINEDMSSNTKLATGSRVAGEPQSRHPITALDDVRESRPSLAEMTDQEKEREAERLFGLFERMDRNPVISAQAPDGSKQSIKDALQAKYVEKEADFDAEEEQARMTEEERDEKEAMRDYRAYLERKAKK